MILPSMIHQKGASIVIAVMIVSAALFVTAITNISVGIGDADLSLVASKGEQAYAATEGCAYDTLRQIRRSTSYGVGSGTITFTTAQGSCTIDITDIGGNQRSVSVVGVVGDVSRRLTIDLSVQSGLISIQSWRET